MAQAAGSFASISTVDGRATIYGYSRAGELPLVVTTGVPESVLQRQWLAKATAPFVVLAFGVLGIVVFGLRLRRALAEQSAYVASQEYLANHDQLTGLPNRYAFLQHVQRLIGLPAGARGFCVLLLDVNRFKDVNDTLGHEAGDAVLQALGTRIGQFLKSDAVFVARLGGDELALCASQLDPDDDAAITAFCERLHAALGAPLVSTGIELSATAGIMIAAYPADADRARAAALRRHRHVPCQAGPGSVLPLHAGPGQLHVGRARDEGGLRQGDTRRLAEPRLPAQAARDRPRADGRRGLVALEPSGQGADRAVRIPAAGRDDRADPSVHRPGAEERGRADRPLAGHGPCGAGGRQHQRAQPARSAVRREAARRCSRAPACRRRLLELSRQPRAP